MKIMQWTIKNEDGSLKPIGPAFEGELTGKVRNDKKVEAKIEEALAAALAQLGKEHGEVDARIALVKVERSGQAKASFQVSFVADEDKAKEVVTREEPAEVPTAKEEVQAAVLTGAEAPEEEEEEEEEEEPDDELPWSYELDYEDGFMAVTVGDNVYTREASSKQAEMAKKMVPRWASKCGSAEEFEAILTEKGYE